MIATSTSAAGSCFGSSETLPNSSTCEAASPSATAALERATTAREGADATHSELDEV